MNIYLDLNYRQKQNGGYELKMVFAESNSYEGQREGREQYEGEGVLEKGEDVILFITVYRFHNLGDDQ